MNSTLGSEELHTHTQPSGKLAALTVFGYRKFDKICRWVKLFALPFLVPVITSAVNYIGCFNMKWVLTGRTNSFTPPPPINNY